MPAARVHVPTEPEVQPPQGRLLLETVRSHGGGGRRVVLVNPDDLVQLGLRCGDVVDVVSEWADGEHRTPGFRLVSYPTPRGRAATYFRDTHLLDPTARTTCVGAAPTGDALVVRFEPER